MKRALLSLAFATFVSAGVARADEAPAGPAGAPPPAPSAADDAPAAVDAPEDEARARVRRGIELYDEGEYRLALVELERAYQIRPSYKILYNLGQVHYQLGEHARAHQALARYLAEGGAEVPAERRAAVEKDLATLARRVARVTIEVNVPDAEILINDVPVGRAPLRGALVDAGSLRVVASKRGYDQQRRAVTLAGGDQITVRIELARSAPQVREVVVARDDDRGLPPGALAGWIVTGALAAGAIGTGVGAHVAASKFETMRDAPIQGSPEQAASDLARQGDLADALALTTDVLIGAAIVAGGVSLWLSLRERPKPTPRVVGFNGALLTFD